MKTKREMREEAIGRLQKAITGECRYSGVVHAIEGDAFYKYSSKQDAEYLIDLLTDDDDVCRCRGCVATKRNNELIELLKDAAEDYQRERAEVEWQRGLYKSLSDHAISDMALIPKDANGEVIHLWDKITYHGPCEKYQDRVYEVRGYGARAGRSIDSVVVRCDSHLETLTAYYCKHYHRPTIEDVLREFSDEVQRCCDTEDTIAEYAKKLQLKEVRECE